MLSLPTSLSQLDEIQNAVIATLPPNATRKVITEQVQLQARKMGLLLSATWAGIIVTKIQSL